MNREETVENMKQNAKKANKFCEDYKGLIEVSCAVVSCVAGIALNKKLSNNAIGAMSKIVNATINKY